MDIIFTIIVIILLGLAVSGLVVGVSNDAVNFLNSAIGSKAAPRKVILAVASVGIIIGALTSSGMMEVARSGVFYPEQFNFTEVMMLFLGVMFANVILLDLFNTAGLPTSTTVSLVFGLLGSAIAVASVKIWGTDNLTMSDLSTFINSGKAMAIISAILVSVVLAFVTGSFVMYITRILFTFHYKKVFKRFGSLWCGLAFTAIAYFAVFKGLSGGNILSKEILNWFSDNMLLFVLSMCATWTIVMFILQLLKVNILRVTVLAGTFSLALAFAGNDLVNFIGVPIAGYDSYKIAAASGDTTMMMGDLNKPVVANFIFLVFAGGIMVVTLWLSKKAKNVTETELNLARQDDAVERFGSTLMSRSIVRFAVKSSHQFDRLIPDSMSRSLNKRFLPLRIEEKERAPFDLIRATVNLTVASLLISLATSLKLPLSTTYVTFMVAMGTSLADRAWGRESAVYRITGVLTVISGWFLTALIAFILAYVISLALMYGGTFAVVGISLLCAASFIQSSIFHKKRVEKVKVVKTKRFSEDDTINDILGKCTIMVTTSMEEVTRLYQQTLMAVAQEDRKALRSLLKESEDLFYEARDRKYEVLSTLHSFTDNYIDTGHYYVQVVDYINEMTKALVHITRPSFKHIDNNHEGLTKDQIADLMEVNEGVLKVCNKVNEMLSNNDFTGLEDLMALRDHLFDNIADALKNQLRRAKLKAASTKTSMLVITILTETKNMVLQSRNLVKSQKYFLDHADFNIVDDVDN